MGDVPTLPADRAVLLVANHGTWWDGFFVYLLNRLIFRRTLHLMMLEEQLRRYPFFRRVGAFGIRQGFPRDVVAALRYAARILASPGNAVCIFPQGVLAPGGIRPLGFRRGIERILQIHGGAVTLLPVAIRCEFLGDRKPTAYLLPGESITVSADSFPGITALERRQEELLDRLQSMITSRGEGPDPAGPARAPSGPGSASVRGAPHDDGRPCRRGAAVGGPASSSSGASPCARGRVHPTPPTYR